MMIRSLPSRLDMIVPCKNYRFWNLNLQFHGRSAKVNGLLGRFVGAPNIPPQVRCLEA